MKVTFALFFSFFLLFFKGFGQQYIIDENVDWKNYQSLLYVASQQSSDELPEITFRAQSDGFAEQIKASFIDVQYAPLDTKEDLSGFKIPGQINISTSQTAARKSNYINCSFVPVRLNPMNHQPERVTSVKIKIEHLQNKKKNNNTQVYPENSMLSSGNWYKIKIDTTGIFKLTYSDLVSAGLQKPEHVRVYGYGGEQLSYMNSDIFPVDLVENPILMNKGGDNIFNEGDYILFFGEGPLTWEYNTEKNMFLHKKHAYSNYIYLFITDSFGPGLRITEENNESLAANQTVNSFNSFRCFEENNYNLIQSGRKWFAKKLRTGGSAQFNFTFPNLDNTSDIKAYVNLAGRIESNAPSGFFQIKSGNESIENIAISKVSGSYTYAREYTSDFNLNTTTTDVNLTIGFTGGNNSSEGYVDFVCVNAREKLNLSGNTSLMFRDLNSTSPGNISLFTLQNGSDKYNIWDITNPVAPFSIKKQLNGNTVSFKAKTDSLREFIAFNAESYLTPIIDGDDLGTVENQNLHGIQSHEMIIVTHPTFLSQAEELADFHRNYDNLSVYITTPQKIYNEFSSGTPDVSAIRNFMRMLYDKAQNPDDLPKYLLLFGDGSYDNISNSPDNTNYILTYQNNEGVSHTKSFVTDDFFGFLDKGEGAHIGDLDIGIGRFPVRTSEEAQIMVDKVKHYVNQKSFGDWRTKVCFIGDDGDGGLHMKQADNISKYLNTNHPELNIDKLYLDAFVQISAPSGKRSPEMTDAINNAVNNGALIIDYVGHGNPRLLTHEEVLSTSVVRSWNNYDKLSVFVTASCEVGRFDDYERTSMGEWFILNPNGGGVATLTTTRVVYSGANNELNENFFENALNRNLRLGDIIRLAKNSTNTNSSINKRNFSLLGDPALKLGLPQNEVVPTKINENSISSGTKAMISSEINIEDGGIPFKNNSIVAADTLNALSEATVHGYIADTAGNILDKLNGVIYPTVYDKPTTISSYGEDNPPITFTMQSSILFKGAASINNGFFDFSFMVPKDINYSYGVGKISLYAVIDSLQAIGYTKDIIIGGNAENAIPDISGPDIELYMNDSTFKYGGTTNENPVLLVKLSDETGINTTGNGIGHNITAIIDSNQEKIINLNSFYQGNIDQYNSGTVKYQLEDLTPGYHEITVKAWDIYNNSSESHISFYVENGSNLLIENLINTPNPFYDETHFIFNHNQAGKEIEITIDIFDMMGNKINTLHSNQTNGGYKISPIQWNGTDTYGNKLDKGMYIYRIELKSFDGRKTIQSSKLMIFR